MTDSFADLAPSARLATRLNAFVRAVTNQIRTAVDVLTLMNAPTNQLVGRALLASIKKAATSVFVLPEQKAIHIGLDVSVWATNFVITLILLIRSILIILIIGVYYRYWHYFKD